MGMLLHRHNISVNTGAKSQSKKAVTAQPVETVVESPKTYKKKDILLGNKAYLFDVAKELGLEVNEDMTANKLREIILEKLK